jgi:bacteriorhodopsin
MAAPMNDPILEKRARIAKYVSLGSRSGYGCLLLSILGFVWLRVGDGGTAAVRFTTVTMVAGSIVLLPAIIFGYAVKAAARHDRELAHEAAARKAAASERASNNNQA